jgi:Ca2+-binding EF-hand superfamily protein
MKPPYQLLLAAILGSTLIPFAQAAPDGASRKAAKPPRTGRPAPGHIFEKADANKDGKVSLEEVQAIRPQFPSQRFQHMDKNGDGFLEREELPTPGKDANKAAKPSRGGRPTPGQLFKESDANKDGKVSLEELQAKRPQFPEEHFQRMDKNGDGFLEQGELPTPRRGGDGNFFARMDTNKDEKISFAEFKKHAPKMDEKRFEALDKNGDGFVQRKEFPQRPPMRPERARGERNRSDSGAYLARLIDKHDTDGNMELSLAELQSAKPGFPESTFAALDRDKNGVLNSKDAAVSQRSDKAKAKPRKRDGKRRQDGLRKSDTNQDGKISFEEAQSAFPNMTREGFDRRDRNGDGFLSPEDRKAR